MLEIMQSMVEHLSLILVLYGLPYALTTAKATVVALKYTGPDTKPVEPHCHP